MEQPWEEECRLRQTYPLYAAACDEEEDNDYTEEDYEADRADDAWHERSE